VIDAAKETRASSTLADLGIMRLVWVGVLLLGSLVLQSTVLEQVTFLGVTPQLSLVVVVSLAYIDGERVGVVTGFTAGLVQDLLLPAGSIVGLTALVYTLVGFAVGSLSRYSVSESIWAPILGVILASTAAEAAYAAMSIMLGENWVSVAYTGKVLGLVVLYNTLLTPFVYPFVRKVSNRFGPGRVYTT
jgi:rod shape-determining protein MreD